MKAELEFVGLSVSGHDEDYLSVNDEKEHGNLTASNLLSKVGIEPISSALNGNFENPEVITDGEKWLFDWTMAKEEHRMEYMAEHHRMFPPVYRVKMVIEAEEVSEEEAAEFWKKKRRSE